MGTGWAKVRGWGSHEAHSSLWGPPRVPDEQGGGGWDWTVTMCCGSGRQERLWSVSWKDSLRAAPELQSVEAGEGGPSLGVPWEVGKAAWRPGL